MIRLELDKAHEFKRGEVLHLKVESIDLTSPGHWTLRAKDGTPPEVCSLR